LDGHDLMPFFQGRTQESPRKEFFYFRGRGAPDAVRVGPWKLHKRNSGELFNLEIDPSERYNRAQEKPELVKQLTQHLNTFNQELGLK